MAESIKKNEKMKKKKGIVDETYDYLSKKILSGFWKSGDRIDSENKLCEELHVSRVTVRAAIQRLVSLGVLESRQGDGTYVCDTAIFNKGSAFFSMAFINQADYINMFEFRRILEVESAGLAAQRATSQMVMAMRDASIKMENAKTVEDIANYDMEFHHLLIKATNNTIIIKAFEMIKDVYMEGMKKNVSRLGTYGVKCHYMIINAIEIRDSDLAKKHMLNHLNDAMQQTVNL